MAYQITALARLAGVSVRTLRYYDEIGLLPPAYVGENGYRYYETVQVDQLQQIRLYQVLGVPLKVIKELLTADAATRIDALKQQAQQLQDRRQQLDRLLALVQATLASQQGGTTMTDTEKFAAFKQAKLAENNATYGDELTATYDETTLKVAEQQFAKLSAGDYQASQTVEARLITNLKAVLVSGEVTGETAQQVFQDHRQWLHYFWPTYSVEKHRGLAALYRADARFQAYYDVRAGQGAGQLLATIIEKQTAG